MTVFETLSKVNVNDKTEKKGRMTYLSWAYAWAEVKKKYPNATYKVYETEDGINYFTDGRTGWVKTSVTIEDIEYIDYLPIMDAMNKSLPLERITSFDVNKTIQRSITKACARHGLGLYIYAGEDLPEGEAEQLKPQPMPEDRMEDERYIPLQWKNRVCEICGKPLDPKVAKRSHEVFRTHMFCSKECAEKSNNGLPRDAEDIQANIEKKLKEKTK